ncbi:isoleucine--tRNA ligase [Microbotryomycetes sp. JL221]|nr:isoleucine--tRNA ligase [Microbotryomycetes sp. JL221]
MAPLNADAVFPAHQVQKPFSFPKEEEQVLAYWRDIDAFQESLRQSEGKPRYSFYDGPPFATGLPHHGHILMGTVKDIVTRFAHSNGYHVERRFGWDTHGLPVEHEIDKKLGITSKQDVMAMGIDKYNAECRAIVMRYSSEWRQTVERLGRWIDFDNDYKTLQPSFMESVWWVFGQLWKKDLVYRGLRVMPYTTGCTTPLSNFEAGQAYKDVQDPTVTVAFPLKHDPSTSLLAWTTTPWTLPANLGLTVSETLTYVKLHDTERNANFILCDKLLTALYKDPIKAKKEGKFKILETFSGKQMIGWKYEPIFPHFEAQYADRAFRVVSDPYVTDTSGTGIVSNSPAFGEDDHRIAVREGIVGKEEMPPLPLDDRGVFTSECPEFEGMYIKDADKALIKILKANGRLIQNGVIQHSYPFCWRSGTPLIYRAVPVWFVKVEGRQDSLIKNNDATRWVPQSVGDSRFKSWLANARDWNISRNRYWGTPLPLWVSDDMEEIVCVSSMAELEELSGCDKLTDLHRDKIDDIQIPSKQGKGMLKRVEEVFDCWFESGSMPYAQVHYPFENKETFEKSFPADFISEAMDQTRGWFYTLLVLANHLFDTAPWKNLIVCGHVLAADGKKMSKSLKNYPDPNLIVDTYGADALRLFLINSPVVRGDSLRFKEEGVKDVISQVLLPYLNSFRFFLGQAALLKKESNVDFVYDPHAPLSTNVMDRWILARCQSLIKLVKQEMQAYRLYTVTPRMLNLIDELTNWYIRFNRRRLKGEGGLQDAKAALNTLFETLLTLSRTASAFIPFLTENVYQGLIPFFPSNTQDMNLGSDVRSVHFLPFPQIREEYFDPTIERQVARLQSVIELGRVIRERKNLPVKTPLAELVIFHHDSEYLSDVESLVTYIEQELNVRQVLFTSNEQQCGIQYKADADYATLGRKLRKDIGRVKKGLPLLTSEQVKSYLDIGKVDIDGIELVKGDLTVTRFVDSNILNSISNQDENDKGAQYESNSNNDVVVLLDVRLRPELAQEGLAREVINRIQRLRKRVGLVATDDINVYYRCDTDSVEQQKEQGLTELDKAIKQSQDVIVKVLKRPVMPESEWDRNDGKELVIQDTQEIGEHSLVLTLVRV